MSSDPQPAGDLTVRWWDGYMEQFCDLDDIRFSGELLWCARGSLNRHIPLRGVRWFALSVESHQPGTGSGPVTPQGSPPA